MKPGKISVSCDAGEMCRLLYAAAAVGAAVTGISGASAAGAGAGAVGSAGVPFVTTAAEPLVSAEVQSLLMWPGCPHL